MEKLLIMLILLFVLLMALPADVGCSAGSSAPTVVKLWAATCDEVGR